MRKTETGQQRREGTLHERRDTKPEVADAGEGVEDLGVLRLLEKAELLEHSTEKGIRSTEGTQSAERQGKSVTDTNTSHAHFPCRKLDSTTDRETLQGLTQGGPWPFWMSRAGAGGSDSVGGPL